MVNTSQRNRALCVKQYIRTEYARFWLKQVRRYGFHWLHASMLELITFLTAPGDGYLLEVGVGTGWPFVSALVERGYTVYGVDLAECLVQEAMAHLGVSRCLAGDAEALPWADGSFNLVYCLQSIWYFPDLARVLAEMVRVTRSGGMVVFDAMNLANARILWAEIWSKRVFTHMRNTRRRLSGRPLLPIPFHEHPATPWRVSQILDSLPVSYHVVLPEDPQHSIAGLDYFHYRLVYICHKQLKEKEL